MSKEKQIEEMMNFLYKPHLIPIYGDCEDVVNALYDAGYRKQIEVAREIFEEIEKAHDECIWIDITTRIGYLQQTKFENKLAELKKKYTEESK